MSEKTEKPEEPKEDDGGFEIHLPFGMGRIWGKGHHLDMILPVIKWLIVFVTLLFAIAQAIRTLGIKIQ